jgi:ribosomal protein S18 acetylase RimI-like enzyme
MQHALDNPAWYALIGPHAELANGHGLARQYPRDVAPFSAIAEASAAAYADLAAGLPRGLEARLFRPTDEPTPAGWQTISSRPIIQMVADAIEPPHDPSLGDFSVLGADDANAMLELAEIAKPGPFGARTYLLGRYIGFRKCGGDFRKCGRGFHKCGKLLAMGGERFRLPGFAELSAIGVHPDARGRGLGAGITLQLARMALARGDMPFLHVFADNPAVALYQRLGFRERAILWVIWRRPIADLR